MKKGRKEEGKEREKEGRMERKRMETRSIPAADDLVDCFENVGQDDQCFNDTNVIQFQDHFTIIYHANMGQYLYVSVNMY